MVRYEIDPNHTNVGFSAKHLAVSTVRGHFSKFDGFFEGPDDDFTQARGQVKIDVASLRPWADAAWSVAEVEVGYISSGTARAAGPISSGTRT
jgi:polyisoprenoid-binding protein YceI